MTHPRRGMTLGGVLALPAVLGVLMLASGCGVSTQQEVQMGAGYASEISKQLPLVKDPEIVRYVNVLGDSLARVADDRSLTWHFEVVDSREVNAFAVPGGYVYINRGLIERAQTMSQVATVMGHEIGHVTRRHSIKQMQKAQGANMGVSLVCILTRVCDNGLGQTALNLGGGALFAKFSRDDETEADVEGIKFAVAAGIDPRGLPGMFRILLDERKARPEGVDAWFLSHPLEEERIAATQAMIQQYPSAMLTRLTVDTPNFQAFKKRLMGLPPPVKR
jgi:predicted Zn-dependent protease